MADSIFLRLDGITGESQVTGFVGQIPLTSVSYGVVNAATNDTSLGKAAANPVAVTKVPDATSPALFLMSCVGTHIATGTISFVKTSGANTFAYMTLDMTEVLVSVWETNTTSGLVNEFVSLQTKTMGFKYFELNAQGVVTLKSAGGFDFSKNAKI